VREAGDRAGHVAEDDELRLVRLVRLVVRHERHAPGAEGRPDGPAEVELAVAAELAAGRQPGRQSAGEREDLAAQLGHVVAAGPQEVDLLGERLDHGPADLLDAAVLGQAAAHLGLDHLLELPDPLLDRLPGDPLGEPAALLALEQALEQRGDERLGRQGPQDPVGEPVLPAGRGVGAAEVADDLAGEPAQRVLVALLQQVAQGVPERVGVGRPVVALPGDDLLLHPGRLAGDGRPPQVEQPVVRRPVVGPLDRRGGEGLPQALAVHQVDRAHRPGRVQHLGQRDRHARRAQRVEERDLPAQQPARRAHG
jgi:hypothetical protein